MISLDFYAQSQLAAAIGGGGYESASSVVQTADGGYVMAGQTDSYGAGLADAYVVKLNASGGLQWTKTIGGTGNDWASSVVQTSDGGYIVAGFTSQSNGYRRLHGRPLGY